MTTLARVWPERSGPGRPARGHGRLRAVSAVVAGFALLCLSGCVGGPPARGEESYPPTTGSPPATATPPAPRPPAPQPKVDAALARGRGGTVRLRNLTCTGLGTGSGFLLAGGLLVTATHVLADGARYDAETWDGADLVIEQASARVPAGLDLAVLSAGLPADRSGPGVLELASQDPQPGAPVRALGYPLGHAFEARAGTVVDTVIDGRLGVLGPVLVLDIALEPGNSGGPVLDADGHVAGVVYARRASDGRGLAMPASSLRRVLAGDLPANQPPPQRC